MKLSKEDISFLDQLVKALEEAELKLEEYYKNNDIENFNNIKKFILKVQEKVSEVVNAL